MIEDSNSKQLVGGGKSVVAAQVPAHRQDKLSVAPGKGRDTERITGEGINLLGHHAAG